MSRNGAAMGKRGASAPAVRQANKLRAVASKLKKATSQLQLLGEGTCSRRDESDLLHADGVRGSKFAPGAKDISSAALIKAAFARNEHAAALEMGLLRNTIRRASLVCSEVLVQQQEERLKALLSSLDSGFVTLKRSFDETPFYVRDADGTQVPLKILNQRGFIRWGAQAATRLQLLPVELLGTDAIALLEGLEVASQALSMNNIREVCDKVPFVMLVCLGDNLSANKLMFEIISELLPKCRNLSAFEMGFGGAQTQTQPSSDTKRMNRTKRAKETDIANVT